MNSFVMRLLEKNRYEVKPGTFDVHVKYEVKPDTFDAHVKRAQEEKKCSWATEGECSDSLHPVLMFDKQIVAFQCANHYEKHIKIMMLHAHGDDVNEVLADDLVARFTRTFGTADVNRESCIGLFETLCPNISSATDEELVDKLGAIL